MQKTRLKKSLSLIVCMVLIVAMALFTTGCNGSTDNAGTAPETITQTESTSQAEDETQPAETEADTASEDLSNEETVTSEEAEVTEAANTSGKAEEETSSADSSSEETAADTESNVLGEGATSFTFTVKDAEGTETVYQINTDQKTVGAALLDLGLIAGEESEYGLYVKTVNGLTVDYDTDGKYWAFYVNGEYAASGVDSTDITAGATYSFVVE